MLDVREVACGRAHFLVAAVVCLGGVLSLPSPVSSQDGRLEDAAWLAGCWQQRTAGRIIDEQWMAPEGGVMLGMSRTVRDGRMRGYELVRIEVSGATLVYIADPSGQEGAEFGATRVTPETLVFENPEHDFPKRIEYLRNGADSLIANVSADGEGFALRMGRIACPG